MVCKTIMARASSDTISAIHAPNSTLVESFSTSTSPVACIFRGFFTISRSM